MAARGRWLGRRRRSLARWASARALSFCGGFVSGFALPACGRWEGGGSFLALFFLGFCIVLYLNVLRFFFFQLRFSCVVSLSLCLSIFPYLPLIYLTISLLSFLSLESPSATGHRSPQPVLAILTQSFPNAFSHVFKFIFASIV